MGIDLRGNPGFTESHHKKLALLLLKNIESSFKKKKQIKNSWIIKPLIFIDVPSSKSKDNLNISESCSVC